MAATLRQVERRMLLRHRTNGCGCWRQLFGNERGRLLVSLVCSIGRVLPSVPQWGRGYRRPRTPKPACFFRKGGVFLSPNFFPIVPPSPLFLLPVTFLTTTALAGYATVAVRHRAVRRQELETSLSASWPRCSSSERVGSSSLLYRCLSEDRSHP